MAFLEHIRGPHNPASLATRQRTEVIAALDARWTMYSAQLYRIVLLIFCGNRVSTKPTKRGLPLACSRKSLVKLALKIEEPKIIL